MAEFENAFAEYIGCRYAVAVSNGTAALHLAVLALGLKAGENVITTPITFAASANCVRYCGGNVYFADIDPKTYLIDINQISDLIASKPAGFFKGIIPVDFAGRAVDLEALRELADKNGMWIVEDACHSPGGYFVDKSGGRAACGNGKFADLSVFSFHPVKHIACGEGGMITTNNVELYRQLVLLRSHGITRDAELMQENHGGWYYEMIALGYNYRLTEFQAALGRSQLRRASAGLERRKAIARKYADAFSGCPRICGQSGVNEGHAYHLYVIEVDDRKALYDFLRTKAIWAQVHYIPVHFLPYYRNLGWKPGDFPMAERYYAGALSLPIYPSLPDSTQDFVIDSVLEWVRS